MINLSSIKTYMYCPMKLYLEKYLDNSYGEEYHIYNDLKNLRIDIQDLLEKNMRKITRKMDYNTLEKTLKEEIFEYLEKSLKRMKSYDEYNMSDERFDEIYNEIASETEYLIKINTLKTKKAMNVMNQDGSTIVQMFFQSCMYTYLIKDPQLDLIGVCDKIEIVNGKYYPISYKSTNPPLRGVWDGDAVELAANAILIEQEFDTEVYVGFIEYQKINERRPVVMDVNLRKSLFEVIHEINEIQDNKIMPKIKTIEKKCNNCEYKSLCSQKDLDKGN